MVRTPAFHAGDRGFEPRRPYYARTAAIAGGLTLLVAGWLSGQWLDSGSALESILRTVVLIAAAAFVIGSLIWALGVRRLVRSRLLGWILALLAFLAVAWFVAIPVGFGVYLSHVPGRRGLHDADLGRPKTEVSIDVGHGVKLHGWYVPSRNRAAVVALHGTGSNRLGVEQHTRLLARRGYGVLALDLRGNGTSGGRSTSAPWTMDHDVDAALRWLAARPDVDPKRLGLLGVSMGAEVAVRVAARVHGVRAIVAEGLSGGASDANASGQPLLAVAQLAVLGATAGLLTGSGPGSDAKLVEQIAPRPILLISAGSSTEADANRMFLRRAGSSARLWNLPDASHASALRADPKGYAKHVLPFLARALAPVDGARED